MALSSSEHTLLVNTCENMNAAAETCRQVLDMLRSLGASGVVDIADHNNALKAHANAKNIFQILDNGTAVLGSAGSQGGAHNLTEYPYSIAPHAYNGSYNFAVYGAVKTNKSNAYIRESKILDIVDENNNGIAQADLATFTGSSPIEIYRLKTTATCQDGNRDLCISTFLGSTIQDAPASTTIRLANCASSGSMVYRYEIGPSWISPTSSGIYANIGTNDTPFNNAYFRASPNVVSDSRDKKNIVSIADKEAVAFINALHPVCYNVKVGEQEAVEVDENGNAIRFDSTPGTRQHWGFIAQEVKQAMTQAGIEDAAVWCLSDKNNPDSKQSLRYEELIAPLIKTVQVLAAKVEALEAR